MKTSHPRALEVARELGVRAGICNAEGTMYSLDCCQADFEEILAELEAVGPAKFDTINYSALTRLQSEGWGCEEGVVDNTPAYPLGVK